VLEQRLESVKPIARSVGTTVKVERLFEVLPVRRSEFVRYLLYNRLILNIDCYYECYCECHCYYSLHIMLIDYERNAKKQYHRMIKVLQGYALMMLNVQLTCIHITKV
jgi:DNA mismatch repair ATPase MutL